MIIAGHLDHPDVIFCIEQKHADRLRGKFSKKLAGKRLVRPCIPDEYGFMDPTLSELFEVKLFTWLKP